MKIVKTLAWAYSHTPEFILLLAMFVMVLVLSSVKVFFGYNPEWRIPAMFVCNGIQFVCLFILLFRCRSK